MMIFFDRNKIGDIAFNGDILRHADVANDADWNLLNSRYLRASKRTSNNYEINNPALVYA
jgi:hypothetical protein